MRGVKTPVFMRFLEAEKQGLQYPDHQFKSGCRLYFFIDEYLIYNKEWLLHGKM